jgi:hypothetical protein
MSAPSDGGAFRFRGSTALSKARDDAHRLIDVLSDTQVRSAVAVLLGVAASAEGRVIPWTDAAQAFGETAAPEAGEGDLDALLEESPDLHRQFEESLEHLRRGERLIPQEWINAGCCKGNLVADET